MATKKIGNTYYISWSEGNDENSGKSKNAPWKSFKKINAKVLKPGDKVLLKRGDIWHERLEIYGGGSEENNVLVSAYGDKNAPKPRIQLSNGMDDICVLVSDVRYNKSGKNQIHECSNLIIEELDLRNTYLGIYFRLKFLKSKNLIVRNIYFHDIFCDETLKSMATKYGGCVAEMNRQGARIKGNLPVVNIEKRRATAPTGAPAEYLLACAVIFNGGYSNVELYNLTLYNVYVGIELIAVKDVFLHDMVSSGNCSFRLQLCENVRVERCRMLSSGVDYTFFGGTCGSYFADSDHNLIKNNELSYTYNLGENDGCALDFEYRCGHTTIENNVFHHNDSGSILFMGLQEGQRHNNVVVENNLSYANIRNPKNQQYNFEFLCDVLGFDNTEETVRLAGNTMFTREISNGHRTFFFGSLEEQYKILRLCDGGCSTPNSYPRLHAKNNKNNLKNYHNRLAFLNDYDNLNLLPEKTMVNVEDGVLTLYPRNGVAKTVLTTPINGFCYTKARLVVNNDAKGDLAISYTLSDGTLVMLDDIKIRGAGEYIVTLADEAICSIIRNFTIVFKPSRGNTPLEISMFEFLPDLNGSANKAGDNEIDVTFGGVSFPMIAFHPQAEDIEIEGYTVKGIEKLSHNTLRVTVAEKVGELKGVKVAAKAALFLEYFKDLLNGLDCERSIADDAALAGVATDKTSYYNGALIFNCK